MRFYTFGIHISDKFYFDIKKRDDCKFAIWNEARYYEKIYYQFDIVVKPQSGSDFINSQIWSYFYAINRFYLPKNDIDLQCRHGFNVDDNEIFIENLFERIVKTNGLPQPFYSDYKTNITSILKIIVEMLKNENVISIECTTGQYLYNLKLIKEIFNEPENDILKNDFEDDLLKFIKDNRLILKQVFSKCYIALNKDF